DVEAGRLPGEPSLTAPELQLGAQDLEEVLGVAAIVDGEARMQTHPLAVLAEQPGGDGVEGSAPHPAGGSRPLPPVAEEAVDAPEQLRRRAPGEGEEEDPLRRHAAVDQVRHAVGEGGGLPGPGSGDEQERPVAVDHGLALPFVDLVEAHAGAVTLPAGSSLLKCSVEGPTDPNRFAAFCLPAAPRLR